MRAPLLLVLALLAVTGCQKDPDADGDGYAASLDCDDGDPTVHPDAQESCNGVDDDCDGDVDDGADAPTWYADADADGYGDPAATTVACVAPDGSVADDMDCDDTNADVHPGAEETCDGVDQDCDGQIDDEPTDGATFYADTDHDGFGDGASTKVACEQPEGFSANGDDCDDSDGRYHPGADEADCGDPNDYNCDGSVGYTDADADGFAACEECDDRDRTVNPGAIETCDGKDDDCDGQTDEGDAVDATMWFTDADGDGFGDPSTAVSACAQPPGTVADATDCDDADPTVNTTSPERCDGKDDDCDGLVDEDDAVDPTTWFHDGDADGYGDATSTLTACNAPSGYVADATDCDDAEPLANPGESEICNDGIDNDCDGGPGSCLWSGTVPSSSADASWTAETGSQGGYDVSWAGDVNGDGFTDFLVGAWLLSTSGADSDDGGAYLVYGNGTAPSGGKTLASALAWDGEHAGDYAGYSVAGAGDLDGDGLDDFAVAAWGYDGAGTDRGAAYVIYGQTTPYTGASLGTAAVIVGAADEDYVGSGVAPAGDVDGDGRADLLVGAVSADLGATDAGVAYLFYGSPSRWTSSIDASTADAAFVGYAADNDVGDRNAMAHGDWDGDGADDLAFGVWDLTTSPYEADTWLFYGDGAAPLSGTIAVTDGDAEIAATALDYGYINATGVGDVDGDGLDDLLVGLDYQQSGYEANAYLFQGSTSRMSGSVAVAGADVTFVGAATDYDLTVGLGDLDGDGAADVVLGSPYDTAAGTDAGVTYLFYGGALAGSLDVGKADAIFEGTGNDQWFGFAVDAGGDIDHDGYQDLLAGAPLQNGDGEVFLFLGKGL